MHLSDRGPGAPANRRRAKYRPWAESLEDRQLLTSIDLATTQSAPLGVQMVGQNNTGATNTVTGAGYTVTDVGDLTGSGFDDYVITADGLTTPTTTGNPTFTGTSTVYLVFGSSAVNSANAVDYLTIPSNQRAGDLGQLGGLGTTPPGYQINPTVTQPVAPTLPLVGYNYNGIQLTTGAVPASGLGFSVTALGDINNSGFNSFAIGAPNDTGGGRVYIIYGGAALGTLGNGTTQATKTFDLEPTTGTNGLVNAGVKVVTLMDSETGTNGAAAGQFGLPFGYSVGGLGNYINYGPTAPKDIAVGAPGYSGDTGAAFAISGLGINGVASGAVVDVSTIVKNNSYGIQYTGIAGSRAGTSVSGAGDFDGYTIPVSGFAVDDFLIGAPGVSQAYLVYGKQFVAATNGIPDSQIGTVQQLSQIGTIPTPTPLYTPLEGLIFKNTVGSGLMGFSASTAGDYNGDGLGDVIIGAPGTGGISGSATIFYGVPLFTPSVTNPVTPPHIVGNYQTPTVVPSTGVPLPLTYQDQAATADNFGYTVSYIGDLQGQGINGVGIGAPNTSNGLGAAYVIPGNYQSPNSSNTGTFPSVVPISTAITSATYAGFQLTTTNSFVGAGATNTPFLGTTISGRSPLTISTQKNTIDGDTIPDVFVGAPGFNLADPSTGNTTLARLMAGESFALEGADLPQTAPNDVILTQAGIGTNSPTGPFSIATTPNNLTIFVYSAPAANGLPAFAPFTDINPATIVVNGVTFSNVTLTSVPDTNGDGVPEASFVINRSLLNLVSGSTISFTIQGTTNAGTVFIARAANVAITTASGGGGGGASGGAGLVGATANTILTPPTFTGINAGLPNPPVTSLEHLTSYQPLPVTIAYQQFLPKPGFLAREEVALHPSKAKGAHQAPAGSTLFVAAIGHSENKYTKVKTLLKPVFTRGKQIKPGHSITFTHKVKVIPRSEQTETFSA